ncbi:hypothetical protein K474DRAFT_1684790 [Panus rudis PR-1116 ss-1]|nr:hypothetical protein K474DRAFT_1684790 [Panus rudis PR-1116 ss-1]
MSDTLGSSLAQLSLQPNTNEDWDTSMRDDSSPSHSDSGAAQNSISFPGNGADDDEQGGSTGTNGGKTKRTLSELLKLHAEKGTDVHYTPEEASRLADVLGEWINSSCSPYEGEDDFFTRPHSQSQDDLQMQMSQRSGSGGGGGGGMVNGRPRGQSESVVKSS